MKNLILSSLTLTILLNSAPIKAVAANDRFICRATCAIVDVSKSAVFIFASSSGKSEISNDEAFEVTEQNCKNTVRNLGYDENSMILVKGMVRSASYDNRVDFTSETDRKGFATSSMHERKKFFVKSAFNLARVREHESTQWTQRENSFSYSVEAADLSSCEGYHPNLEGNPKYIGPDTPLG